MEILKGFAEKKIWKLDFHLILCYINHKSTFEWIKKKLEFMRTRLISEGLIGVWMEAQ